MPTQQLLQLDIHLLNQIGIPHLPAQQAAREMRQVAAAGTRMVLQLTPCHLTQTLNMLGILLTQAILVMLVTT